VFVYLCPVRYVIQRNVAGLSRIAFVNLKCYIFKSLNIIFKSNTDNFNEILRSFKRKSWFYDGDYIHEQAYCKINYIRLLSKWMFFREQSSDSS